MALPGSISTLLETDPDPTGSGSETLVRTHTKRDQNIYNTWLEHIQHVIRTYSTRWLEHIQHEILEHIQHLVRTYKTRGKNTYKPWQEHKKNAIRAHQNMWSGTPLVKLWYLLNLWISWAPRSFCWRAIARDLRRAQASRSSVFFTITKAIKIYKNNHKRTCNIRKSKKKLNLIFYL